MGSGHLSGDAYNRSLQSFSKSNSVKNPPVKNYTLIISQVVVSQVISYLHDELIKPTAMVVRARIVHSPVADFFHRQTVTQLLNFCEARPGLYRVETDVGGSGLGWGGFFDQEARLLKFVANEP